MACQSCSNDEYVADRLSIWKTANSALRAVQWGDEDEDGLPSDGEGFRRDVYMLAAFLAGDDLP